MPCPPECGCWDSDGDGPCSGEWDGIVAGLVAGEAVEDGPGWWVPGVTWDTEPGREMLPSVSPVLAGLAVGVERLGVLDPVVLPDGQVLVDAEALQALVARLRVLQLGWTAAVEVRDLPMKPKVLRGLPFSRAAISSSCSWVTFVRSVRAGKYWRSKPLVFSLVPRCQGLSGSQE